jgi:membrane protein
VLTVLFAIFFRWFPDGPLNGGDAWRGGLATAILFNLGKLAIAWYIGRQLEST